MTYTVQRGDTPASISAQLGVSWQDVTRLNASLQINPNFIYAGQILQMPATRPRYVNPPFVPEPPATRPRYVNPPTADGETADAVTVAAMLEAAKKKKAEEQQQLLIYGGIALLVVVLVTGRN